MLLALTGYGTPHLTDRLAVGTEPLLHYAGLFALSDIGYDARRYPAQRIGESKTEAGALSRWVPSPIFLRVLERKLASILRSQENADRVIGV